MIEFAKTAGYNNCDLDELVILDFETKVFISARIIEVAVCEDARLNPFMATLENIIGDRLKNYRLYSAFHDVLDIFYVWQQKDRFSKSMGILSSFDILSKLDRAPTRETRAFFAKCAA